MMMKITVVLLVFFESDAWAEFLPGHAGGRLDGQRRAANRCLAGLAAAGAERDLQLAVIQDFPLAFVGSPRGQECQCAVRLEVGINILFRVPPRRAFPAPDNSVFEAEWIAGRGEGAGQQGQKNSEFPDHGYPRRAGMAADFGYQKSRVLTAIPASWSMSFQKRKLE